MKVFLFIHFISLLILIIISFADKEIRQDRGRPWDGRTPGTGTPPSQVATLVIAFIPILNTIFAIWYIYDKYIAKT